MWYVHAELTVKSALVPVELGCAGERRGAERSTSGVNFFAMRVMLSRGQEPVDVPEGLDEREHYRSTYVKSLRSVYVHIYISYMMRA
jgi:hypothetical protein